MEPSVKTVSAKEMDIKGETMKLSELDKAICLDQYPDAEKNGDLKDLTFSIKARVDEFQKKFKEYNRELLEEIDDDEAIKGYIEGLANEGLRAIDDHQMNKVVGLLSPMIGKGSRPSQRFDRREDEGVYDAAMTEVLVSLQELATGEFMELSDVPIDFTDQVFREELIEHIEELIRQLENIADNLVNIGSHKASTIDNNHIIPERIKHLAIQIALLKIDMN